MLRSWRRAFKKTRCCCFRMDEVGDLCVSQTPEGRAPCLTVWHSSTFLVVTFYLVPYSPVLFRPHASEPARCVCGRDRWALNPLACHIGKSGGGTGETGDLMHHLGKRYSFHFFFGGGSSNTDATDNKYPCNPVISLPGIFPRETFTNTHRGTGQNL